MFSIFKRKADPQYSQEFEAKLNQALEIFSADVEIYNQAIRGIIKGGPAAASILREHKTDRKILIADMTSLGRKFAKSGQDPLAAKVESILENGRKLTDVEHAKKDIAFRMLLETSSLAL